MFRNLGIGTSAPDYAKTTGQVYQELLTDLLRWRPKLLNLLIDANNSSLPGAPSWVPNWSTAARTNWIGSHYLYSQGEPRLMSTSPLATRLRASFVMIRGSQLTVKGCIYSTATLVCNAIQPLDTSSLRQSEVLCHQP
ncbi:hypothetical protein F5Y15DRAFT_386237 [Xylariaceae sp. FL0016]|nr:hypothetical protein F5Y15DRAFT_386237 [Xylariaceae sp. FL0016]